MLCKGLIVALCLFSVTSFISIAVANIFLGISFLLFLIVLYKDRGVCVNVDGVHYLKVIAVFAVTMLISALFSGNTFYGLKTWGDFFIWRFMPSIMIIYVCDIKKIVNKILYAVMFGFMLDCLYAIYQGVFVYKVNIAFGRAAGFVGHPMTLAGWACILLPVLLVFVFQKDLCKKTRLGCGALFVLGCIALVFNATRGAWLSLAVVLPLIMLPFVLRNRKLFMTSVSLVLLAGVMLFNTPSFMKRVDSISDGNNWSNASRFIIWNTAYDMFVEHPILGIGLGQFGPVFKSKFIVNDKTEKEAAEYRKYLKNKKEKKLTSDQKKISKSELNKLASSNREKWQKDMLRKLNHAHNNFMQMLAENGIIGFFGYVFAFGYVLWHNLKKYLNDRNPYALMIVGSTTALKLQGLTEYNFGNSSVMKIYWLVLACLIVLVREYDNERLER